MEKSSFGEATSDAPEYPALMEDMDFDAVVVGAGFTGISTALLLAESGAKVAVVEADRIGSGTSGRSTVKITCQHTLKLHTLGEEKAQAYYAANKSGFDYVCGLIERNGIGCDFERLPAYVYARGDECLPDIEKEARIYSKLGIDGDVTEKTGLPFGVKRALVMRDQAQFHQLKYLFALARRLAACGGSIFERTKAERFERGADCAVITKNAKLRSRDVIFATNYPMTDFPGLFFLKLHQEREYAICTKADGLDIGGMYISAEKTANSMRIYRSGDENRLILVGYGHRTAKEDDGFSGYDRLKELLRRDFKTADPDPDYAWSAQDCCTLDGIPYVGPVYAGPPGVYVAAGYEKWGVTNSAAAAMMISDAIAGTGHIDRHIRKAFDPLRFTPAASAKNFLIHAGNVAGAFTAGNILMPEGCYDDLKPGEGAVMRVDAKAQAVYRDTDGELHAFEARCTHMRCPLEYNAAEKSFDCPCHGSRFGTDGEVLNGPANEPLGRITERPER